MDTDRRTTGARVAVWLALAMLLAAAGCMRAARRPAAPPPQQSGAAGAADGAQPQVHDSGVYHHGATFPLPRAGNAFDDVSAGIAAVAAAVPGAGQVEAIAAGNTVLVALNADRFGAQRRTHGALGDRPPGWDQVDGAESVYRRVAAQIQTNFPHIVEVRYATDDYTAAGLVSIAARMRQQEPIGDLLDDLGALSQRMTLRYAARPTPGGAGTPQAPQQLPPATLPTQ